MNPTKPKFKLLFLCTGNSARSILAEFLLRKIAAHKFEVVSVGASPNSVPAHFHITEVGRMEKNFVDCGGKTRHHAFASLQVCVADDTDHRLPSGKLATIIEKTSRLFGTDDLEMQVECQEGTVDLFSVEGFNLTDGSLVFTLDNKQAACLALEVCVPDSKEEESCCGGSNCCR